MELKVITQETFDAVVRENIDDFEMDAGEALSDAIEQFEKQKVNLNMIIKSVAGKEGHEVLCLANQLSKLMENKKEAPSEDVKEVMEKLANEFDKDISYRYQASKASDAAIMIYKACISYKDKREILKACMRAFASLLNGQPDLITPEGIVFVLQLVKDCEHMEEAALYLRILKFSATAQEGNRAVIMANSGPSAILECAEKFKDKCDVVVEGCGALRALTLDDDIRVEFGKAHEYTKELVNEHHALERLFKLVKAHESDVGLASDVVQTLSKLMVRNEFCQQAVDLGTLDFVITMLAAHMDDTKFIRQSLALVKVMSRNDEVKRSVIKSQAVDLMMEILQLHQDSPTICESIFATLTTVSLRNPSHCDVIMSKQFAPLLIGAMERHNGHAGMQKQACMVIRNLVARTRNHQQAFISLNVEALINKARKRHGDVLDEESKAALRDLDLEVNLNCRWRNQNGSIEN